MDPNSWPHLRSALNKIMRQHDKDLDELRHVIYVLRTENAGLMSRCEALEINRFRFALGVDAAGKPLPTFTVPH